GFGIGLVFVVLGVTLILILGVALILVLRVGFVLIVLGIALVGFGVCLVLLFGHGGAAGQCDSPKCDTNAGQQRTARVLARSPCPRPSRSIALSYRLTFRCSLEPSLQKIHIKVG